MSEILSKLDGDGVIAAIAIIGGLLTGIIAIAASAWQKVRRAEADAALRHDMLNRGMSAEEIRTVLDAGRRAHWWSCCR